MKRILGVLLLVGIIVIAAVLLLDGERLAPSVDADREPGSPATGTVPVPPDAIAMEVVSITDGDTLRLLLAEEPNELVDASWPIAVRLIGIDTPEVHPVLECFGAEAEAELARLAPVGSTLRVAPDEESWDRYDRRLFYLWTAEGEFVNLALVAGGFAEAIRVAPNDRHFELLRGAEQAAASAGLGMWGACPAP